MSSANRRHRGARIGILTAGGDCPGLNAGIAELVDACRRAGATPVGIRDGYAGLVAAGESRPATVDLDDLDAPGLDRLARTGGSVLGSSRTNIDKHGQTPTAVAGAHALGLDALVAFGGDGSLNAASSLSAARLTVVGIPKTIDDDVAATERAIGFATAVHTGCDAVDRIADTAVTHANTFVVEVMGRRSGFLAAAIADATGSLCAVPEQPWSLALAVERLAARRGGILVVAEGTWPVDLPARLTRSAKPVIGDVAVPVAAAAAELGLTTIRSTTLGHTLRGGTPVAADRLLARRFARLAVDAALASTSAICGVHGGIARAVPIAEAARGRRFLTTEDLAGYATTVCGV